VAILETARALHRARRRTIARRPQEAGAGARNVAPRRWTGRSASSRQARLARGIAARPEERMLRRLYDWTMAFAGHRHATLALGAVSFAESSFFPIPPDVLLVPMVLADRTRAYVLAAWCTLTSVLGGILGYAIGALLYDSLGLWLIGLYGYGDQVESFRAAFAEWGAWIILIKGLTPIPYKVVTITSGFAGYDFLWFVALSILTRGARFYIEAVLLRRFGPPIRDFIERRLEIVTTVSAIVIVGGFVAAKYLL
jgi:membrane protein YqaA with SNARE-associated domain